MEEYLSRNKKRRGRPDNVTDDKLRQMEQDMSDQRERMFALREENRMLREELDQFRANEKYVTTLMLNAQKAAEKIVSDGEIMAAKKIYGAQEQEKRLREMIAQYQQQLVQIEMQTSKLLSDIVETVSRVKHPEEGEQQRTAREIFRNAAAEEKDEVA